MLIVWYYGHLGAHPGLNDAELSDDTQIFWSFVIETMTFVNYGD